MIAIEVGTLTTMAETDILKVAAEEAVERCFDAGWTDGLPVVPPTRALVERMLGGRDPDAVVGDVPPLGTGAQLRTVATNAVMAGCLPEHFPVVLAALRAALDPAVNIAGVQATTHVGSPLILVCGPIVERLAMNAAYGLFSPGNRANATIGRALQLILRNVGGAIPGSADMSTFGNPLKFSGCIAERQAVSPWPSYQVDRGFDEDQSTVTVVAVEAPKSIVATNDLYGLLDTAADTMATLGAANLHLMGQMLYLVGPEHAGCLGAHGWSRGDVQEYLFEHARRPVRDLTGVRTYSMDVWSRSWPPWVDRDDPEAAVPIVEAPEDIHVVVAGGDVGRFSVCCPGWGRGGRAATVAIDPDDDNEREDA